MWFKQINSDEYERLSKRITKEIETFDSDISKLKKRVTDLELENESLRNKVLRKVQKLKGEMPEEITIYKAGQKVRT